jgi:hypothetical protein
LEEYAQLGVVKVIIEQPLINSNNVYTVATLMKYNTLISKAVYDVFGVVPQYISTYDSRKYAFPELVQPNDKGQRVLFGAYDKSCDKKQLVWELVAQREPQVQWFYTKNGTLKKESYDCSDAYTVGLAWYNRNQLEK